MDQRTLENWKKVKAALEAAGKTDSYFYKRAAAIIRTGVDPDAGSLPHKM
jgi:ribosomal protein S19E (S16A)